MTPDQITGDIYLPLGRELQAAWWMFHIETFHAGVVMHGVPVKRVKKVKVRDLVG